MCRNGIFIAIFLLVYNHFKLRIVVISLALNEPFIPTSGAGPCRRSQPCCTAMFLQELRTDKPNIGPRVDLSHFYITLRPL